MLSTSVEKKRIHLLQHKMSAQDTTDLYDKSIFLYQNILKFLVYDSPPTALIYIQGGKGMGKTSLLMRIRDTIQNAVIKSGKEYHNLKNFLSHDPYEKISEPYNLIIDDIDQFIKTCYIEKDSQVFEYIANLDELSQLLIEKDCRVIMSGRIHPLYFINPIEQGFTNEFLPQHPGFIIFFSKLCSRQNRIILSPWDWPFWKRNIDSQIDNMLSNRNLPRPFMEEFLPVFKKANIQLTGGHPTLLGITIPFLIELTSYTNDMVSMEKIRELLFKSVDADANNDHEALLKTLDSILKTKGLPIIDEALRQIKKINKPPYSGLLDSLINYAKEESDEIPSPHRKILIEEGLLYSEGGRDIIPGRLISTELQNYVIENDYMPPSYSITPTSGEKNSKGNFIAVISGRRYVIPLRGSEWKILNIFIKKRGEIITPAEIRDFIGEGKVEPVRTAIWRLQTKFKKIIRRPIIINEWGKGYSINEKITVNSIE